MWNFCCDCGEGRNKDENTLIIYDSDEEPTSPVQAPRPENDQVSRVLHQVEVSLGQENGWIQEWAFYQLFQVLEGEKWDPDIYHVAWKHLTNNGERLKSTLLYEWFLKNYSGEETQQALEKLTSNMEKFKQVRKAHDAKAHVALNHAIDVARNDRKMNELNKSAKDAPWTRGLPPTPPESPEAHSGSSASSPSSPILDKVSLRISQIKKVFLLLAPPRHDADVLSADQLSLAVKELIPHDHQVMQKTKSVAERKSITVKRFLKLMTPLLESFSDKAWSQRYLDFQRAALRVSNTPRGGASSSPNPRQYGSSAGQLRISPSPGRTKQEQQRVQRLAQLRTLFRFYDHSSSGSISLKVLEPLLLEMAKPGQSETWFKNAELPQMDTENDGNITLDEFIDLFEQPLRNSSEQDWQPGFEKFRQAAVAARPKSPRGKSRSRSKGRSGRRLSKDHQGPVCTTKTPDPTDFLPRGDHD